MPYWDAFELSYKPRSPGVAEKCGFTLEATLREPFYHRGRNVDVLMHSLMRTDPRPWRTDPPA